jgi:hypothetical protein
MEYGRPTEDLLRRYLLGLLVSEEQQRFEEQLLIDDEYLEELSVAEDELIDSYVRGSLSDKDRERFEQHFLVAKERQRKLSFAQTLHKYVAVSPLTRGVGQHQEVSVWKRFVPPLLHRQPALAFSVVAALVIVILGGSWLIVRSVWVRDQTRGDRHSSTLAITLRPGVERDTGETKRVTIPADVSALQLHLVLSRDEHQSYRAVLERDDGNEVLSADNLKPESLERERVLILSLRAGLLVRGDYRIKLSGLDPDRRLEEIGKYHFRVIADSSQP